MLEQSLVYTAQYRELNLEQIHGVISTVYVGKYLFLTTLDVVQH